MKARNFILIAALAFGLAGCNSGINQKLDTGHGAEAYKSSLAEAVKKMEKQEVEAFDWAVSDLTLEKLNELYPSGTPREIIRSESKKIIETAAKVRPELEGQIPDYDKAVKELTDNIVVESTSFAIENDFFGPQPKVSAKIVYPSGRIMTALQWRVELFLDGKDKPVASTTVSDNYKSGGGFKPGYKYNREFKLGFVSGDARFTSLEIQNAKQRVVKLTLIPEECVEMNGREVSYMSPHAALRQLDEFVAMAKKYKNI